MFDESSTFDESGFLERPVPVPEEAVSQDSVAPATPVAAPEPKPSRPKVKYTTPKRPKPNK